MPKGRVIFHIDVNSAFVSWSAVKIMAEGGEDIRLIPSVVSGDPSDRRSIVSAKSIPCKKYGINTAEPVSMALRKCPGLVIVRGDWEWYSKCSSNFIAICRTYSPTLEQFSIDECFLDMTERLQGRDPVKVANELRKDVSSLLGFTVNVGVGSNKLLAKMASDFEKPDKVHTLWDTEVKEKMWPLPVRDLLWVGKKTEERLVASGVDTIGKLATLGTLSLGNIVGSNAAAQLHMHANGIDDSPVETETQEAKSCSAERTFSKDISDPRLLDRELFKVAVEVAHRIRLDSFKAGGVSVFVKTKDFEVHSRQHATETPTDVTALILNEARRMIPSIWDGVTPLRQVGLGVFKLTHEENHQLSLFEDSSIDAYRAWDIEYDEKMLQQHGRHRSRRSRKTLLFAYKTGEEALSAAKRAVKENKGCTMARNPLPDGTDCFEIRTAEGDVLERHTVIQILK
ncbi:MAG: DNA polymerase IV [Bacteroidales bacterium]|nr:DNA polymerase IV [Candidatus Cryptobacteroides faecihippi]